jgi:hypothetical protein
MKYSLRGGVVGDHASLLPSLSVVQLPSGVAPNIRCDRIRGWSGRQPSAGAGREPTRYDNVILGASMMRCIPASNEPTALTLAISPHEGAERRSKQS